MERSKLKQTIIFLLIVLNLCLLGIVLVQGHHTRSYEKLTREQALIYLSNHGIQAGEEVIPWKSGLEGTVKQLPGKVLEETPLPSDGLGDRYEVQVMRRPETLIADFVRGLEGMGGSCTRILEIREGYRYFSQGDRAVLTPVWSVQTDQGFFYLDCAAGAVSRTL